VLLLNGLGGGSYVGGPLVRLSLCREYMMLYIAIAINSLAIIWFLIFLEHRYTGILIGASAIIWFFVFLKRKQDELEVNFQKRFSGKTIRCLDKCAVFRAQESHGYSQSQGKGYLVLTDNELYFEMTLLSKVLSIPTISIIKVGQTNRLLGVNPGRTMLKIDFEDNAGNNDSIVLNVKELGKWKKEITAATSERI
jgi:hypothetical protein